MLEFYEKYNTVPRQQTCTTIDKPMLIFLGLALNDFVAGVFVFLGIVMFWESGMAVPVSVVCAFAAAWLSREYRRRLPARFLSHLNWSLGIQRASGIPMIFRRERFRVYGP